MFTRSSVSPLQPRHVTILPPEALPSDPQTKSKTHQPAAPTLLSDKCTGAAPSDTLGVLPTSSPRPDPS